MKKIIRWLASLIIAVSALNVGLTVFFGINLVAFATTVPSLDKIIYAVIGLSGLYVLIDMFFLE